MLFEVWESPKQLNKNGVQSANYNLISWCITATWVDICRACIALLDMEGVEYME